MKAKTLVALGTLEIALGLGIFGDALVNGTKYKATSEEIQASRKWTDDAGLKDNFWYPLHESMIHSKWYTMPVGMVSGGLLAIGYLTLEKGFNRKKQNNSK